MKKSKLDAQTAAIALQAVESLLTLNDGVNFMDVTEWGLMVCMERDLEYVINKSTK